MRPVSATVLSFCLTLLPCLSSAQGGSGASGGDASYEQRYAELKELKAEPHRVATVNGLVLKRDVGQFTFESGKFYLLTPIGGHTVAAVFLGRGLMAFEPPNPIEQERL
ncbi:MAG: hypothetical protein ACJ8BF_09735, partial [Gemmatimonadales bacterium]